MNMERSEVLQETLKLVCTLRHAACGGRTVPPPTVPTSTDGMVQLGKKTNLFFDWAEMFPYLHRITN